MNNADPCQNRLFDRQGDRSLTPGSTLFCDFDGPIVDVSDRYYSTYKLGLDDIQAMYQEKGVTLPIRVLSKKQFWLMKQNCMGDVRIAHWSGLKDEQVDIFINQVKRIVNQPAMLHRDRLQPDLQSVFALLKRYHIRLVLVTLRHHIQVTQFLQANGLAETVDQIYGASDIDAAYRNRTEHKAHLLTTAIAEQQQQGFDTNNAWMVGDTEADIIAGKRSGLQTIGLTCGVRSNTYLQTLRPTQIHPDLLSAVQKLLFGRRTLRIA
ncbi:MAG: HAD hydrolase-like protein [Leptolyngbyaceae cyanobacterium MO_188.B28]|nr:HAD hydrolase-like protein [Leptolyngbyaceae cyanobacterium MO_188.B28]